MATCTGPVTPIWKVFDDKNGQLLAVKEKPGGALPRIGDMLHHIDEHHTHWEISKVGELTAEDLKEEPPLLYYPLASAARVRRSDRGYAWRAARPCSPFHQLWTWSRLPSLPKRSRETRKT